MQSNDIRYVKICEINIYTICVF